MNCPHTVVAYADRNSTHGVINWQEPYATDNHDSVVNVTKEGSISPGDEIAAEATRLNTKLRTVLETTPKRALQTL